MFIRSGVVLQTDRVTWGFIMFDAGADVFIPQPCPDPMLFPNTIGITCLPVMLASAQSSQSSVGVIAIVFAFMQVLYILKMVSHALLLLFPKNPIVRRHLFHWFIIWLYILNHQLPHFSLFFTVYQLIGLFFAVCLIRGIKLARDQDQIGDTPFETPIDVALTAATKWVAWVRKHFDEVCRTLAAYRRVSTDIQLESCASIQYLLLYVYNSTFSFQFKLFY